MFQIDTVSLFLQRPIAFLKLKNTLWLNFLTLLIPNLPNKSTQTGLELVVPGLDTQSLILTYAGSVCLPSWEQSEFEERDPHVSFSIMIRRFKFGMVICYDSCFEMGGKEKEQQHIKRRYRVFSQSVLTGCSWMFN